VTDDGLHMIRGACRALGIELREPEPIRLGENAIWRIPGVGVARVARPGQAGTAAREVRVGRWLAASDVPAVEPLAVEQPFVADGRAVTFWRELEPHRNGRPAEVADALRRLHRLQAPPPEVGLGVLDPFVRLTHRIEGATSLSADDRAWLLDRATSLRARYRRLPPTRRHCVVHGDAWAGNVVATASGRVVFVDLERFAVGPPEWDLVSTAVKHHSLGAITADDYRAYCGRYGLDVTKWAGYETFRDIREIRMATYVAQLGVDRPDAAAEADHRVRCLRGAHGPRPWHWTGF
jgi:aminoglycoside phosphotransferase (APT) family kinase protein